MAHPLRFEIDRVCRDKIDELQKQVATQTSLIIDPECSEIRRLAAYEMRFELQDEIKKLHSWISRPSTANLAELGLEN